MNYHYGDVLPGKVRRTVFYLREYFFPFGCSLCGAGLVDSGETWRGLCETCHAGIEREIAENRGGELCDCCGKPLISEHGRCIGCRQEESRSFDRVNVLFPYTGKYRQLLTAYKFGKNLAVGNFFAEKIRETLQSDFFPPEARIVPVPPRPGKIRNSGWDQVEYLARLLERNSENGKGLIVDRCLKRMPSISQKKLGRENRKSNLRGRILPVRQVPKIAVMLDDVMTTGSTLDACAAALKEAGAQTVYGLCLFYN
ncbi:MAG: ComF family protein [Treponema sp.]|jgi:ComF family protein|nr:ComF family protein [Treponema sp.]